MKKIVFGLMGLIMTLSVVTASAYALFSSQATVSGINFSTSSVSLLVSGNNVDFTSDWDTNLNITNAFPGFGNANDQTAPFFIKNASSGVGLSVTAQLTAATNWGNGLQDYVQVAVVEDGTPVTESDYKTLATWNAAPVTLPGGTLAAGGTRAFDVYVRMPSDAPTSLQNLSLTDIAFTLVGTQAL